jgi:hypothetical protein
MQPYGIAGVPIQVGPLSVLPAVVRIGLEVTELALEIAERDHRLAKFETSFVENSNPVGQTFHLMHRWWDGTQWSAEEDLGGKLSSGVGVSSSGKDRLDCFVQGTDSAMHRKWYS